MFERRPEDDRTVATTSGRDPTTQVTRVVATTRQGRAKTLGVVARTFVQAATKQAPLATSVFVLLTSPAWLIQCLYHRPLSCRSVGRMANTTEFIWFALALPAGSFCVQRFLGGVHNTVTSRSAGTSLLAGSISSAVCRDMVLSPEPLGRTEIIEVKAGAFWLPRPGSSVYLKSHAMLQSTGRIYCMVRSRSVVLANSKGWCHFPEDLGGHRESGPSSIWTMQESETLEALHQGHRGRALLCQLAVRTKCDL